MRGRAFKEQFRLPPQQCRTPSPPLEHIEPLTPIDDGGGPSFPIHTNNNHRVQRRNKGSSGPLHNHLDISQTKHHDFSSPQLLSSDLPPQRPHDAFSNPQFSPAQGSPIDTLANAASSLAPSPIFAQPSRRASQAPPSPIAIPHFQTSNEQTPKHDHTDQYVNAFTERPSKRARSEVFPSSPQHNHTASRPATSHIPTHPWSYNVEQMVDNRMRLYQDNSAPVDYSQDSNSKRLSDAQLLLDFQRSANAFSRPSHTSMTERWSPVQPRHTDLVVQHSTVHTNFAKAPRAPHPLKGNTAKEPPRPSRFS
jgi:F-box and leucine-rich repeat protein 10/11